MKTREPKLSSTDVTPNDYVGGPQLQKAIVNMTYVVHQTEEHSFLMIECIQTFMDVDDGQIVPGTAVLESHIAYRPEVGDVVEWENGDDADDQQIIAMNCLVTSLDGTAKVFKFTDRIIFGDLGDKR